VLARYAPKAPTLFRYPYLHEGDTLETRGVVRAAQHARGFDIAPVTIDFSDLSLKTPELRSQCFLGSSLVMLPSKYAASYGNSKATIWG
jgi:hypothetical protein